MLWLAQGQPDLRRAGARHLPRRVRRTPAAVLVPLVEREHGWTVLLTQRAATLKDHAGQISFPGGRIEPQDESPWQAALREAHEEIGLSESFVEFAGYLPDHRVVTGFRVTPVVGFVNPLFELRIATAEVHDVFEVPLDFILDSANHKSRMMQLDDMTIEVCDIPYGDRIIWGATAGMLLTFRRMLLAAPQVRRRRERSACRSCSRIMARLRAPDGCPWDREQTFASIAPYTIEEAYEVADAIERGDLAHLQGRARRSAVPGGISRADGARARRLRFRGGGRGDLRQAARRHPHVFAGAGRLTAAEQSVVWEDIKAEERGGAAAASALDGVPRALPALMRAHKLSKRAARVGFDFEHASQTADKVAEELAEVREAAAAHEPRPPRRHRCVPRAAPSPEIFEEIGDLLFAAANLARKLDVDAEAALRAANAKFERRFRAMEALAAHAVRSSRA